MKRRWVAAGLLAFLAGLNRPTSAALIGAVGLAAIVTLARRESRREHGVAGPLYAMFAAPLGLLTYVAWVGLGSGDLTAYFTLQREGWAHYFDFGKYTWDVLANTAAAATTTCSRSPSRTSWPSRWCWHCRSSSR